MTRRKSRINLGVQRAFGRVLRDARLTRGLSQEALAMEANLDRTYPSMLERGLRSPTIDTVIELAAAIRVPAAALVERTVQEYKDPDPALQRPARRAPPRYRYR